jgi:hypothetical protein
MTRYHEQQRNLKPAIPCLFLYDTSYIDLTASSYLHWNNILVKTSEFTYTVNDDTVFINSNGFYEIHVELSGKEWSGTVNNVVVSIELNGIALAGGKSYINTDNIDRRGTAKITYIKYLKRGDEIKIKAEPNSGQARSVEHTSRLLIKFIPIRGWNNKSGGKIIYRGGVIR